MKQKIFNKTKKNYLAQNACTARTFFQRLMGLMFKKTMTVEDALIFHNVSSIHMFFMQFPIDVVYLDRSMKVVKIKQSLQPWRMSACPGAKITIEFPANTVKNTPVDIGDTLEFIDE